MNKDNEEYLTRCVVDPISRKFYLYSDMGKEKTIDCDTVDQFMNVLEVVRSKLNDKVLVYANPL